MHYILKEIQLKEIKRIKLILDNLKKKKFQKFYLFPNNAYSRFVFDRYYGKKKFIIDNYNQDCLPFNKIKVNKEPIIK